MSDMQPAATSISPSTQLCVATKQNILLDWTVEDMSKDPLHHPYTIKLLNNIITIINVNLY